MLVVALTDFGGTSIFFGTSTAKGVKEGQRKVKGNFFEFQ